MQEITEKQLNNEQFILFIYTPFCGTCSVGRAMLEKIEAIHGQDIFYEMNGSYHEEFMHQYKVESVPCLLIKEGNEIKERIYTFHSTGNIYEYLLRYKPELFASN